MEDEMPNKTMRRDELVMPTATRADDVAKRLEQLKGKSNQGLVPDNHRGPASPLGHGKADKRKGRP